MSYVDSNGIIRYEATDGVAPLHTALNAGMESVSDAIDSGVRIWKVNSIAARDALLAEKGASAANPLYVDRSSSTYGWEVNRGSGWEYVGVGPDTGWVPLDFSNTPDFESYGQGWPAEARRIGVQVFFRGMFRGAGGTAVPANINVTVARAPSSMFPGVSGHTFAGSTSTGRPAVSLFVNASGYIDVRTGTESLPYVGLSGIHYLAIP